MPTKQAFLSQLIGVPIPQKRVDPQILHQDEEYKKISFDKVPTLKAAFLPDGM